MTPIEKAVEASYRKRVMSFITGPESEPVQMFAQPLRNRSGDWYGEHVGKWLCTAALAWHRTQDDILRVRIESVVDFLEAQQEPSGYLGTYAANAECRFTHPKAHEGRTWDIWNHAWTIMGLARVAELMGNDQALEVAKKAMGAVMAVPPSQIIRLGNHRGLSSVIIIEPLLQMAQITKRQDGMAFAEEVLRALGDSIGELSLIQDVADVGTGKSYQICWLLNGISLFETSETSLVAEKLWDNIAAHHLSALGGPWGGIATHKEVFNRGDFFSPDGLTETCATQMWMRLCARLYQSQGQVKFLDAWNLALHNALLGAMDDNGHEWCYFTFPNGRRNNTYHWACCNASGALALEEAMHSGLLGEGDPPSLTLHQAKDTLDHHGQEIVRREYVAVQYGKYIYATGPLDGYKRSETICIPQMFAEDCFEVTEEGAEDGIPSVRCKPIGRAPFIMRPYFQAGGRHDGAWRTTWLEVAWQ